MAAHIFNSKRTTLSATACRVGDGGEDQQAPCALHGARAGAFTPLLPQVSNAFSVREDSARNHAVCFRQEGNTASTVTERWYNFYIATQITPAPFS